MRPSRPLPMGRCAARSSLRRQGWLGAPSRVPGWASRRESPWRRWPGLPPRQWASGKRSPVKPTTSACTGAWPPGGSRTPEPHRHADTGGFPAPGRRPSPGFPGLRAAGRLGKVLSRSASGNAATCCRPVRRRRLMACPSEAAAGSVAVAGSGCFAGPMLAADPGWRRPSPAGGDRGVDGAMSDRPGIRRAPCARQTPAGPAGLRSCAACSASSA